MKRHASLVPLSRDHHHGLVMAERLIRGRSTNPRADWPSTPAGQLDRLLAFFTSDLLPHFTVEERYLFPAAAAELGDGRRLTERLAADHDALRAMVRGFEADPVTGLDERLVAFGERLRAHIRVEERELFERLPAECAAGTLAELGDRIGDYAARAAGSACER